MLTTVPAPLIADTVDLTGTDWTVFGDVTVHHVADPVVARLADLGAAVTARTAAELAEAPPQRLDGVLYLCGWGRAEGEPELPETFTAIRAALRAGPRWVLAVSPLAVSPLAADPTGPANRTSLAGPADPAEPTEPTGPGRALPTERAAGLRGLFRTLAREYPDRLVRLIELDATTAAADILVAELGRPTGAGAVVVHRGGARLGEQLTAVPPGPLAAAGAGPAADGAAEAEALGLDRDAVILLVGGARGITAGFTTLLAGAARCRLELAGRTAPPAAEHPRTAGIVDRAGLIQAVRELGHRTPGEARRAVAALLAGREITATLADVEARGGQARYRQLDVLDADAVQQAVKQVFARHGRLDGVVYSAGVIEDALVADKDPQSFRRVFDTKVAGARTLLAALAELPVAPRFLTFFGSIAGVLGNRGQGDYAAANDALETLGAAWSHHRDTRTITVHWGPWAPSAAHPGMVDPGLEAEFARRGVDLIDPDAGHLCLLRELAWGPRDLPAVVYSASSW
ncbi:SDR family NAD(P)-dependent oxidoreductase [Frankia torreyi]|uniref:SDR family NAD(P)-dependent oxidoreductase n=1 Tax=Frankia torreyi TaxID=1856 RepID=UPI0030DCE63E